MSEQYLQDVLKCKNATEAYFLVGDNSKKPRYFSECLFMGQLASYALNKPKNVNKPRFEDLDIIDIYTHLVSEVFELKNELKQSKVNYERVLSETCDIAALCTGLIIWVLEHKDDEKEE
jgi:hypothetical protein